jgi:hypothetical protein
MLQGAIVALRGRFGRPSARRDNDHMSVPSFAELAATPDVTIDVLALALAGEFRDVDASGVIARLDVLGAALSHVACQTSGTPDELALTCAQLLGVAHGFTGDRERYDHPERFRGRNWASHPIPTGVSARIRTGLPLLAHTGAPGYNPPSRCKRLTPNELSAKPDSCGAALR